MIVVLKLQYASESSGELVKMQIPRSPSHPDSKLAHWRKDLGWLNVDGPLTTLCMLSNTLPVFKIFLVECVALQRNLGIHSLEYV